MRCPSCEKFVPMEMQDPEVESIDVENNGSGDCHVSATVRIVRTCEECGEELKEATLDMEDTITLDDLDFDEDAEVDVEIEEEGCETIEEGGGRYAKSYFGATVTFKVTAKPEGKDEITYTGELSEKVAASEMEEMV